MAESEHRAPHGAARRTFYGRAFVATPLWLWFAQRASGLLLGPLVLYHVWEPTRPRASWLMGLLLLAIALHGYAGIRRLGLTRRAASRWHVAAIAWTVIVGVAGLLVVIADR